MASETISSPHAPQASEILAGPGFAFGPFEAKFRPPLIRSGIVPRPELVGRLLAAQPQVITVVAPPGYGKTTLMTQWAARLAGRVAWVSCDAGDNDPVVLLSAIASALTAIEPVDPAVFSALAAAGAGITFVPRFVAAVAGLRAPVTIVFDHCEAVTNRVCQEMLAEIAVRLPVGWRLAFASRTSPPVPAARLRVQGGILELDAADLAMTHREAQALVAGAGAESTAQEVRQLLDRTEGWPAALYLAALAQHAGAGRSEAHLRFAGDDRFVQDYLQAELLDQVSDAEISFLTRTSVLDRMCGALCDAVLTGKGSALTLEGLERRNLLVVPLDRRRNWYRYHHLLRDLLKTELQRREPELLPELHVRAAAWFEANHMPEPAIQHAEQAGDFDRAARLVLDAMQPVWASGRVETVRQWMEALHDKTSVPHYGAIAVHGALIFALLGRAGEAERWAAAAERAPDTGTLPDGNTMAGTLAYLRAIRCTAGVRQMRRDARLACDGLSPSSPYRTTMLHTEGLSYLLDGDPMRADALFARAYDAAADGSALPVAAFVLAERCIVAVARDDWTAAIELSRRAVRIVDDGGLQEYWTSAPVYALAARTALHSADITAAHRYLAAAARLRPLLTYAIPVVSTQTLVELARAYLALGDAGGAAAVLMQAQEIVRQRPDLGTLPGMIMALQAQLAKMNQSGAGSSSLTAAELRLLPLLATHLSFREIAERRSVSFHTVKSQAYSIYQKLGVSSRSQAVAATRELGLADV